MLKINQAALDIGQLAEQLFQAYYLHSAMLQVARHPNVGVLVPSIEPGQGVPIGRIYRRDGSSHTYHFSHYLAWANNNSLLADDLAQVWLVGALLRLGDRLAQHHYFDRAPELELLRHLRNGTAHGNRFHIPERHRLVHFPAHNRLAWVHGAEEFEITPPLHGMPLPVRFHGTWRLSRPAPVDWSLSYPHGQW